MCLKIFSASIIDDEQLDEVLIDNTIVTCETAVNLIIKVIKVIMHQSFVKNIVNNQINYDFIRTEYQIAMNLDIDLNTKEYTYSLVIPEYIDRTDKAVVDAVKELVECITKEFIFNVLVNPETLNSQIQISPAQTQGGG